MPLLHSLLMIVATLGGEPRPAELVGLLGSADRVERDEAARTLEETGAEALPALDAAVRTGPVPVRAPATTLERSIRGKLLRLPTLVPVDFAARPLDEVVATLAERSGHPLVLDTKADPAVGGRLVDASSATLMPFWEALDLIGRSGHVRHDPGFLLSKTTPRQTIHLVAGDPATGTLYSGPFRIHLLGIQRRRDLNLSVEPGKEPSTRGVMYAEVQAFVEPGRWIDHAGPARVEAIDDRGRRLPSPPSQVDPDHLPINTWRYSGEVGLLQWRIPLDLPDRDVLGLQRLAGTLPMIVSARKPDPLVISLTESAETSARRDGTLISYRFVKATSNNSELELTLVRDPAAPAVPLDRFAPLSCQFAFEDNDGQPVAWQCWRRDTDADGRTVLGLWIGDGPRPIRLRYYGLTATTVEVPFEFTNIGLP